EVVRCEDPANFDIGRWHPSTSLCVLGRSFKAASNKFYFDGEKFEAWCGDQTFFQ
ncbi:MAG: hypothetical protein MHPSP_004007, partial [Paramarteilia canceri]